MNPDIQRLEQQLDDFDANRRQDALTALWALARRGEIALPQPGGTVNLHSHTFYSYNVYGYSPSKFAWLARKVGLAVAGIVDFDALDGLAEFHEAGRLLGLKTVVSLESRVFVPEFFTRIINSPGEPGIAYHMGVGFTRATKHPILDEMRKGAAERNREMVGRVNRFLAPVKLDYEADVLPLTPNGNATERHICAAYERKAQQHFGVALEASAFWQDRLGDCPHDSAQLQALMRATLMKHNGVGCAPPDTGSFPWMVNMNRMVMDAGAIPTFAWLDGASEGEDAIEELLRVAMRTGVAAINIIPDRNFTRGMLDKRLKNLQHVIALAEQLGLLVFVGTEMNAPTQKFVDDFTVVELQPFVPVFLKGAYIAYAHTALERHARLGYVSSWARKCFNDVCAKNTFFEEVGRRLQPYREDRLDGLTADATPGAVLDKIK